MCQYHQLENTTEGQDLFSLIHASIKNNTYSGMSYAAQV